jgi:hypothetical protein
MEPAAAQAVRSPPDRIAIESDQAACERDKAMQRTLVQLAADGKTHKPTFTGLWRLPDFGRSFILVP